MSSDIEMLDTAQLLDASSSKSSTIPSPPPLSHSSRTSSVSLRQSLDGTRDKSLDPSTTNQNVVLAEDSNEPSKPALPHQSQPPLSAKPVSTKPKSSKPRPRSPSPSPPPPPPPPLQTVRLEIQLGGPENYEVDISGLSKATGQRPPTPVPTKRDTSDSEGGDDDQDGKPKKKKKKRGLGDGYYDLADPFIDDSELAMDERTYFAQTKQQGFYVSSGEVALLKDKTPKKPRSKRLLATGTLTSAVKQEGTKDSPIALLSDADEDRPGHKRKRYMTVVEGGKKRKIVDVHSFHPDLQLAIEGLKQAITQESWETKGKFPPAIKPLLVEVAIQAIRLDEYDEHFFNLMPVLFPYNKFTMTKLIKRTVFADHTRILMEQQDALLQELAVLAKEGFPKAVEEYEKTVAQWEKKQEKVKLEAEAEPPSAESGSIQQTTEDAGSGVDQENAAGPVKENAGAGVGKEKEKEAPAPPSKKYRMTEAMKAIVWRLVLISNEICRLENEKNTLEGSTVQVSEQGLRKILYQKIVSAFQEGWMSSGQISREVSSIKKRLEKEAMENEP